MEKKVFGYTKDNKTVYSYIIKNKDLEAEFLDYGCIVRRLVYKGVDVVLGFDDIKSYENQKDYYGCLVGRYANRISKGKFWLNGKEYSLNINNGNNHLHGGNVGLNKRIWSAAEIENGIVFSYLSPDGEEKYPGNLNISVEYKLEDNTFIINYFAKTDKDTICNLTNHSFFNLNGHGNGNILEHTLIINASSYTPVDTELITTGEIKPVINTVYDFLIEKRVGKEINREFDGYDINFCLDKEFAAILSGDKIKMEVYTNKPGIQLYTGNNIDAVGKENKKYKKYSGLCLETQYYPDSINKENFPSPVLKAGEKYKTYTIYKFI